MTVESEAKALDKRILGVNAHTNRHIPVTTLGGAKMTVDIDICLDYKFNVGKISKKKKMLHNMSQGAHTLFSAKTSHVLASNTVKASRESTIGSLIEHVDHAEKPKRFELKEEELDSSAIDILGVMPFGNTAILYAYDPVMVSSVTSELEELVTANNNIMSDYLTLKTLQNRNPTLYAVYRNSLFIHLLDCATAMINEFLNGEEMLVFNDSLQHMREALGHLDHYRPHQNYDPLVARVAHDLETLADVDYLAPLLPKLQLIHKLLTDELNGERPAPASAEEARESRRFKPGW